MAYLGRKSGRAALIAADIPSDLTHTGSHVVIPSVTTANLPGAGDNSSITPVDGMLVYNSTLGMLQQRAGGVWSGITTAPVITSFTYSDGASATAENPAGGGVITVTGTNFDSTAAGSSSNVGLTFGGTTATSISVNSLKTVITATVPAKAAGTVTMQVVNASGLTASTNFIYDTEPVFSTAEAIGNFADGVYTANASAPRIVAAEGADTISYARVTSLTDDTVISTTVAGLTLCSTGYLTGTLAGTNATTYPFYAQATDAENQNTPKLFNIISYDYASTGGTIIEPGAYTGGGYRSHTFFLAGNGTATNNFVVIPSALTVDILIVAGGGASGYGAYNTDVERGGNGGAGGMIVGTSAVLDAGTFVVVVGAGGTVGSTSSGTSHTRADAWGHKGGDSSFTKGSDTAVAQGGGGGGGASYADISGSHRYYNGGTLTSGTAHIQQYGEDGGSGGGSTNYGGFSTREAGNGMQTNFTEWGITLTGYGNHGTDSFPTNNDTNGGCQGGGAGSTDGSGLNNLFRTGANVEYAQGGSIKGAGGSGNVAGTGAANTGQGGSTAGSSDNRQTVAYAGGTGIVVIRYAV